MSPPEIWGPPVWTFFHVLAEKVDENAYKVIKKQMFIIIKKICGFLPCPECSRDANNFLGKINMNNLTEKTDFKNMLYFFHNHVNFKKRKGLYKYSDLEVYKKCNIVNAFNNFIRVYHTKGNMNQLNESFQRQFVIKDVRKWLTQNIRAFINMIPNNPIIINNKPNEESLVTEKTEKLMSSEEYVVVTKEPEEEPVVTIEEPVITNEEPVITNEEPVVTIEEPVITIEEPVITIEEPVITIEEPELNEVTITIEQSVNIDNIYIDNEFVSQNTFESNSHLFKDNLQNEKLNIENVYSDNVEVIEDNLMENVIEKPTISLSDNIVVKKKSNKRKKK